MKFFHIKNHKLFYYEKTYNNSTLNLNYWQAANFKKINNNHVYVKCTSMLEFEKCFLTKDQELLYFKLNIKKKP